MRYEECDDFTKGYIKCALWLFDDDAGPGDWDGKEQEFVPSLAPDAVDVMVRACKRFQEANAGALKQAYGSECRPFDEIEAVGDNDGAPYTAERAGHDFWLTRNHHGAGFWDRDLGPIGDALTDAAHEYGETEMYRGDDGLIYVT